MSANTPIIICLGMILVVNIVGVIFTVKLIEDIRNILLSNKNKTK